VMDGAKGPGGGAVEALYPGPLPLLGPWNLDPGPPQEVKGTRKVLRLRQTLLLLLSGVHLALPCIVLAAGRCRTSPLPFLSFSLSLSLSHTHTHSHARTHHNDHP
jgi:hypothetical protein